MKKILYTIAALVAVSCNLNQVPFSQVVSNEYVKDDKSVENLVIGAYNSLYGVLYSEWAVTELRSNNARMRVNQSTSADSKLIEQLDQGTILTANSWVQDYWDACYKVISRANSVLPNLEVVEDPAKKAQFEGEVRFLRAWMYFNIVRLWGPAFIVTSKMGADEARHLQRSSEEDVYALIEQDLEAVVDGKLLPGKQSGSALGRADLRAAQALLAKVYVTHYKAGEAKYAKALDLLSEVLDASGNPSSGVDLVPFNRIFATDNECNAEIILAVRYRSGNLGMETLP